MISIEKVEEVLGEMHLLELQIEELETERDRYKKALEAIWKTGHNNDCLFCGFKDKIVKETLNPEKSDSQEEE